MTENLRTFILLPYSSELYFQSVLKPHAGLQRPEHRRRYQFEWRLNGLSDEQFLSTLSSRTELYIGVTGY